tara:strand:- start:1177 stop:1287 length:111 start_codon:yes stop_codon:yes gene_type:complete
MKIAEPFNPLASNVKEKSLKRYIEQEILKSGGVGNS